jgi:hypothetical protein
VLKDVGAVATGPNPIATAAWGGLERFRASCCYVEGRGRLFLGRIDANGSADRRVSPFELLYDTSQLQHTRSVLETALVGLFTAILRDEIVIVNYSKSWSEKIKTAAQGIDASAPQQAIKEVKDCVRPGGKVANFR